MNITKISPKVNDIGLQLGPFAIQHESSDREHAFHWHGPR